MSRMVHKTNAMSRIHYFFTVRSHAQLPILSLILGHYFVQPMYQFYKAKLSSFAFECFVTGHAAWRCLRSFFSITDTIDVSMCIRFHIEHCGGLINK